MAPPPSRYKKKSSKQKQSHHVVDPDPDPDLEPEDKAVYISRPFQPLIQLDEDDVDLQNNIEHNHQMAQPPIPDNTEPIHSPVQQFQQPIQPYQLPVADPDQSESVIQRYFFNGDVYARSGKSDRGDNSEHALHVIGRPVDQSGNAVGDTVSSNSSGRGPIMVPLVDQQRPITTDVHHHVDYRVIKSKRRPSWLQNAGQWFKGRKASKS